MYTHVEKFMGFILVVLSLLLIISPQGKCDISYDENKTSNATTDSARDGQNTSETREPPLNPAYLIKKCQSEDMYFNTCIKKSINSLLSKIRNGIPELDIQNPEPIVLDEIRISEARDEFQAIFKDIKIFGVSNIEVIDVWSETETGQYWLSMFVPTINVSSKYESSSQSPGSGKYSGKYEGTKIKMYFKTTQQYYDRRAISKVQLLGLDFRVKKIRMEVGGFDKGNFMMDTALNFYLNKKSQPILNGMKSQLKAKFLILTKAFCDKLFSQSVLPPLQYH